MYILNHMNNITMVRLLLFADNIPDYIFWRYVDIFDKRFCHPLRQAQYRLRQAQGERTQVLFSF